MWTIGEGALSVTELFAEGMSSELCLGDCAPSALLIFSSGDEFLLVWDCRGCGSDRASRPAGESAGAATVSSKWIRERSGENAMRSGACGERDACMPAALRSTRVLLYSQSCKGKVRKI